VTTASPITVEIQRSPLVSKLYRLEDAASMAVLVVMALLPLFEIPLRVAGLNLPGVVTWVALLTLWIGFAGAMIAARDGKHLSLTGGSLLEGKAEYAARLFTTFVAAVTTGVLAYGAYIALTFEMESTETLPLGIPAWLGEAAMPIGYAVVALRLITSRFSKGPERVGLAVAVAATLFVFHRLDVEIAASILWPLVGVVVVATVFGSPIYVLLGALALLLFWAADEPIASVAGETVRQIKSPIMPTIPLFTFTGYVLAEANTSKRLVRIVRALFGGLPGGMAIMTAIVCAFFTTFTGASGVTILALGGLLYPMLIRERYPDDFSVGLLTASGSIGLLFPPSLVVILYGVIAHVPIDRMFVAGILPGVVLVLSLAAFGVITGLRPEVRSVPHPFDLREAAAAIRDGIWELFLPVIVLGGIFLGLTTLVEAAALTAAYALFIEVVVYKDLQIRRDLVRVAKDCASLIGGVLIILGVAMGLTSYMVDAEVPAAGVEWVRSGIESRYVFLLLLNLFLLVVGCLMDIFSALVVVVPLILPIAKHYGIDPIHLGVIFLANLELGFLTPPVGMNLFLASYRFEKPLTHVYRVSIPFLAILLIAVLLITYLPWLTLAPVEWVFGHLPEAPPIEF
jgi:tripartite ATP-independent transporter DctM subunit